MNGNKLLMLDPNLQSRWEQVRRKTWQRVASSVVLNQRGPSKMLIIWRGYGWLVPIVVFGAFILTQMSVNAMYGEGFYKANAWPKHLGTITGAILVGALGYFLNHVRRAHLVDEETGEMVGKAPSHSLFFIPIEYWSVISLALFFWATL